MKRSLYAVLSLLLAFPLVAQTNQDNFVNKTLYPATVLLFSQDESGGMHMRCTATAIAHDKDTYTFVTAAHCGSKDDQEKKIAEVEKTFFYISPDNVGKKEFLKADVIAAGYQSRGDDFLLFSVKTDYTFPLVELGSDPETFGEPVINVAAPLGLGRQVFFGNVSMPKVDRAIVFEDINWTNTVLLVLPGTNGGSSGSSVVCVDQKAICSFLVGTVGSSSTVSIPVSRFKDFYAQVKTGTYKFYKKSDDN
jgi:hypothetical protein